MQPLTGRDELVASTLVSPGKKSSNPTPYPFACVGCRNAAWFCVLIAEHILFTYDYNIELLNQVREEEGQHDTGSFVLSGEHI